jgi:hypothetical protein
VSAAQTLRAVYTSKGVKVDRPSPHPLSWWTNNPLARDESGELMIGFLARDGAPITAEDYRVHQKLKDLGGSGGARVIEVITTIEPQARVVSAGFGVRGSVVQWKSLLVQQGRHRPYLEIYHLQAESGMYAPLQQAKILKLGSTYILETFDPDTGNGGGCADGYWQLSQSHTVGLDFSQLQQAIKKAVPLQSVYSLRCRAIDLANTEVRSRVQRADAQCRACGWLGTVIARFRVEQGVAVPDSVRFERDRP